MSTARSVATRDPKWCEEARSKLARRSRSVSQPRSTTSSSSCTASAWRATCAIGTSSSVVSRNVSSFVFSIFVRNLWTYRISSDLCSWRLPEGLAQDSRLAFQALPRRGTHGPLRNPSNTMAHRSARRCFRSAEVSRQRQSLTSLGLSRIPHFTVFRRLESITLNSINKFRYFLHNTLLDILFYWSPTYAQVQEALR